jgi:hypothetical protein
MHVYIGHSGNIPLSLFLPVQVAPFDAAVLVLAVAGVVMCFTWPENYGNRAGESVAAGFSAALSTILKGDEGTAVLLNSSSSVVVLLLPPAGWLPPLLYSSCMQLYH